MRTLSQLLARAYDNVLSEETWPGYLDFVAHCFNAEYALFQINDPKYEEVRFGAYNDFFSKEDLEDYALRHASTDQHYYQQVVHLPAGRLIADSAFQPPAQLTHAHKELAAWFEERGVCHRSICRINDGPAWIDLFAMGFDRRHGPLTAKGADLSALLLPHIAKVLEINRVVSLLRSRFGFILAAFDRFRMGVLILSEAGEVVLANREAERIVGGCDGISRNNSNKLAIPEPCGSQYARALSALIRTARAEGTDKDARLLLKRRGGWTPLILELSPLRDRSAGLGRKFVGVMAFLIDPDNRQAISTDRLADLYGLTEAEREVLRLIALGHATLEIAEIRSTTPGTTRAQIKRILAKTGTHSRVDLIRLALTVTLPIDPVSERPAA